MLQAPPKRVGDHPRSVSVTLRGTLYSRSQDHLTRCCTGFAEYTYNVGEDDLIAILTTCNLNLLFVLSFLQRKKLQSKIKEFKGQAEKTRAEMEQLA